VAAGKRIWLARLLTVLGIACLGYYGYIAVSAAVFHREQLHRLEALRANQVSARTRPEPFAAARAELPAFSPDTTTGIRPAANDSQTLEDGVVGLLEIPRLGITTPVVSGDDDEALEIAVGHLPDTPLPWEPGNSAVAAHRDGIFRPLENVRKGDRVIVRTTRGDFEYQVQNTQIVPPTDLSVLEPLGDDALTLITCYPFNYIGSAPKRFIVHAIRTAGPMTGDDGLLRSRSLSTMARYSAATARGPHVATNQTTGERRQASLQRSAPSRARSVRAQKANAARVGARRADASAAARKRNGRDALRSAREKSPAATKDKKTTDEAPRKRRWYHIFRRG
jgi:sortase A